MAKMRMLPQAIDNALHIIKEIISEPGRGGFIE
jgi:hypothetical protein